MVRESYGRIQKDIIEAARKKRRSVILAKHLGEMYRGLYGIRESREKNGEPLRFMVYWQHKEKLPELDRWYDLRARNEGYDDFSVDLAGLRYHLGFVLMGRMVNYKDFLEAKRRKTMDTWEKNVREGRAQLIDLEGNEKSLSESWELKITH